VNDRGILIAGGYGVVGRRIAIQLAPDYPECVVIAGRNLARAREVAAAIGHGARGRQIDVTGRSSIAAALDGVGTVVSCIDQPGRLLLWAAVQHGLQYTDITPHLTELGRGVEYEKIDAAARSSGARLVLGTGIVPGISNVVVGALADALGGAGVIETALLLSAGDAAGPASFDYFLQEMAMSFNVRVSPHCAATPQEPIDDEHATLLGQEQADAAAAGAAEMTRVLIEDGVAHPGAWMPEQVVDPSPFLSRLTAQGLKVEFPEESSSR
jgi:saccharopine dehydrogenase-like NADP-dependent oxidoreductase